MTQDFPSPDEIFQERYRIVSVIDRGGFGRVYRAEQVGLKRDVAIKVLQPVRRSGVDKSEEARRMEVIAKRFTREAQLVSQLRDNHTVTMHDYGTTDAGLLYMVLEYIHGDALNDLIEERGALAPERVVKIARQILSSLEEAHALGMLHRDIKPGNVMLFDHAGRTDQVKVLDFGLAKSVESGEFTADDPDLTGDEVILGTPRYMSPEQIRGESLDARTDIYSLGLVMFEMLTGFKAVEGDSTMQTLARHLNDIPIRLPETAEIPVGLRYLVNRMLLKNPDERYASIREVLDALDGWDDVGLVPDLTPDSDPDELVLASNDDRRRNLVLGIGGVMALFLIIAIVSAFAGDSPDVAEQDAEEITRADDQNTDDQNTDDESVVAEIRTDETEDPDSIASSDGEQQANDPFAKAGVSDEQPLDEEGEEPTDEGEEPGEMILTAEETGTTETEADTEADTNDDDHSEGSSSGKRSTKHSGSGNNSSNKLKLRVLQ